MRHPYFSRAIQSAYEQLIPAGESPNYFIYFEVNPASIDVNIHPTKTEIKFENEQPLWQILAATVKEALGKSNETPSIDFDTEGAVNIPIHNPSSMVPPKLNLNPNYNPFKVGSAASASYQRPKMDWEVLYKGFEKEKESDTGKSEANAHLFHTPETGNAYEGLSVHYQYKNRYILTSVKSGLMIIDQHLAHVRILFERFLACIRQNRGASQRALFPEIVEFTASEAAMLPYLLDDFEAVGFDLANLGNNSYAINGVPSEIAGMNPVGLLHNMVSKSIETGSDVKEEIQESLALSMAYAVAIPYGRKLSAEEIIEVVDGLFASSGHNYTPDGRSIISILSDNDIEKMMR
jgi:DNA mismatch repair protein MutL